MPKLVEYMATSLAVPSAERIVTVWSVGYRFEPRAPAGEPLWALQQDTVAHLSKNQAISTRPMCQQPGTLTVR
jgi:hypothetical protein